jgi:hypothetical protein
MLSPDWDEGKKGCPLLLLLFIIRIPRHCTKPIKKGNKIYTD